MQQRRIQWWPMGIACMVLGGVLWWKHPQSPQLSAPAQLGKLIFHDVGLSASGQQSCATCHVASLGHASSRGLEAGGAAFEHTGTRNVPSLRYLKYNHALQWDEEGKASGGFFWDGRADSLQAQAGEPFLNPHEMANTSRAEVVQRLQASAYAGRFSKVFGNDIWRNPDQAFDAMTSALASYQTQDPVFQRFDSLFDRVKQGQAQFSAEQERGWRLFQDEEKGNCAACHTAQAATDGTPALFTDFSYDNLGVPRHTAILANAKAENFDLGMCKPKQNVCGAFKVPSLRNVAVRRAFFHNARFDNLHDALAFYASRDTDSAKWYGKVSAKFNDVPKAHQRFVNTSEVPYGGKLGQAPKLSAQDIDDLQAFLHTLTDADLQTSDAAPRGATALPPAVVHAGR
jgi:cytochrome c peroxidase